MTASQLTERPGWTGWIWHALAWQLACPTGLAGRAIGHLMGFANREPTRKAIANLDIQPGHDVLDLGCGAGQAMVAMLPLCVSGRVRGMDQSATMVGVVHSRLRRFIARGRATVDLGRFESLPFADGSFDRILASNVAYFWYDMPTILAEIRRVLRPGGRCSLYLTSAQTMASWKIADAKAHRLFTAATLQTALLSGPFTADQISVQPVELKNGVHGLLATLCRA